MIICSAIAGEQFVCPLTRHGLHILTTQNRPFLCYVAKHPHLKRLESQARNNIASDKDELVVVL